MDKPELSQENLLSSLEQTIDQAAARHKVVLTTPAREYLLEMLERFAEDFGLYQETWLTPLTFQYQRINDEVNRAQRMQLQRQLGDHCLFLVGYFYDFVRQHGEGQVRYHAQLGSAAYQQIGRIPYRELGQKFDTIYLVIGDLHLPQIDEKKIITLYQKWLETGDSYYKSLLIGKGIMPKKISGKN